MLLRILNVAPIIVIEGRLLEQLSLSVVDMSGHFTHHVSRYNPRRVMANVVPLPAGIERLNGWG
jgi:hypothetical protein